MAGTTFTVLIAALAPQPFVVVYKIVATPAVTPVTTPAPLTPAIAALVLLHVPPVVVSVKVIDEPGHTLPEPVIVPALGRGLIVTIFVVVLVAQALEMV